MADTERRKHDIVKLANKLLNDCNINEKRVNTLNDLNSNLFVRIYEGICATELIDKIQPTKTIEDEIHNIQSVVDSLSLDILHEDLTHITGEAIVNKDLVSIEYLLDILASIQEWITSKLEESSGLNSSSTSSSLNINNINNNKNSKIDPINQLSLSSSSSTTTLNLDYNNSIDRQIKNLNLNNNNSSANRVTNVRNYIDNATFNSVELLQQQQQQQATDTRLSGAEKYKELESRMKDTVRLTQNAVNLNPISRNYDLVNVKNKQVNDSWLSLIEPQLNENTQNMVRDYQNSILNSYNKRNDSLNRSGGDDSNSSITSGIGVLSEIKRKKEEILGKFVSNSCENFNEKRINKKLLGNAPINLDNRRRVKFNDDVDETDTTENDDDLSTIDLNQDELRATYEQNTTNELSIIRNGIDHIAEQDKDTIKQLLKTIYDEDLKDAESLQRLSLNKIKNKSEITNDIYLRSHQPEYLPPKRSRSSNKSTLIADDYKRPLRKIDKKPPSRASSVSPSRMGGGGGGSVRGTSKSRFLIGEEGILGALLDEFPNLYLSPETIHELWTKHAKQIEGLSKEQKELEEKYSKNKNNVQVYLEQAHKKQKLFMDLMRKEILHLQRVQDLKRKQTAENALKCRAREQRFQSVRVKRYLEEFRLQQRSKMLKKVTKEEVMFKKLFNESLKIQRERIREMKRYAKDQREIKNKQHLNQIESIENFYKNKFQLLNERLEQEKRDVEIREKAQHEILSNMKSQLRRKLETDIRDLQEQLWKDDDFMYWRQLDANRLEGELKYARYQAKV